MTPLVPEPTGEAHDHARGCVAGSVVMAGAMDRVRREVWCNGHRWAQRQVTATRVRNRAYVRNGVDVAKLQGTNQVLNPLQTPI